MRSDHAEVDSKERAATPPGSSRAHEDPADPGVAPFYKGASDGPGGGATPATW